MSPAKRPGRPRLYERPITRFVLYLPAGLRDELKRHVAALGLSVNRWAIATLRREAAAAPNK